MINYCPSQEHFGFLKKSSYLNGCKHTSLHMAAEKGSLDSCKLVSQEIGNENLEDDSKKSIASGFYQKPSASG